MQLSNQQALPVSQQQAWEALNNIDVLRLAIPGCDALVEVEPGQYEIHITAVVGPVKAKFKGKLRLSDLTPPSAYRIDFEGQGGAAGHGKGSAAVRIAPVSACACVLHYEATATVGGKIAQIGQRLVDMAAQKMASEFFAKFGAQLTTLYPAARASSPIHDAVAPRLWLRLKRWLQTVVRRRGDSAT